MFIPSLSRSLTISLLGTLCFGIWPTSGFAQHNRSPHRGQQQQGTAQQGPGNGQFNNTRNPNQGAEAAAWAGIGLGIGAIAADAAIHNQRRNQEARSDETTTSSTRRHPGMMDPNYPPNGGGVYDYRPQYPLPQYVQPEYAQPQYIQAQPVVVPPVQYVQPVTAAVAVPANTVPQPTAPQPNELPAVKSPSVAPKNVVGSQLALAGPTDRSKIAKAVEKRLKSSSKEFGKDVEAAGLGTDDVASHLVDVAKSHGAATKDLEEALEDGTPKDVDKALKGIAGISDGERRKLVAEFSAGQAARDLQEVMRAGGSQEDLADASDRLDDALTRLGSGKPGSGGKYDTIRHETESAIQLAEIHDLAKAKSALPDKPGSWILSPDQLTIVETPGYPPGTTLVMGPDLVVLGSLDNSLTVHAGTLADLGVAVPVGPPVADSTSDKPAEGNRGVVLVNPSETGGGIHYTVSGYSYAMEPGESQTLATGTDWVISFDRGENKGQGQYTLADGSYEFFVTAAGWDLRSKLYAVTLDNTTNAHEFHFVVDGKSDVVAARQNKTLRSKWPVTLLFDRGDGKAPARKEFAPGTYRVGVDLASNLLEIYPGKASTLVAETSDSSLLSPRGN